MSVLLPNKHNNKSRLWESINSFRRVNKESSVYGGGGALVQPVELLLWVSFFKTSLIMQAICDYSNTITMLAGECWCFLQLNYFPRACIRALHEPGGPRTGPARAFEIFEQAGRWIFRPYDKELSHFHLSWHYIHLLLGVLIKFSCLHVLQTPFRKLNVWTTV